MSVLALPHWPYWLRFEIFAPGGYPLTDPFDPWSSLSVHLPISGQFLILASSGWGDATGSYQFVLERLNAD